MLESSLLGLVSKSIPDADPVEVNELAAGIIRAQAASLVTGLSRTRKEVMRRVLAQGVERGWSDAVLRRRMAEVAGLDVRRAKAVQNHRRGLLAAGVAPSRAERQTQAYARRLLKDRVKVIADHELRVAYGQAQRLVWQRMQEDGDLSRWAVRITKVHKDERLCPTCRPQHGRRRSLHKDLTEGPPFHPRCRCEEYLVDEGIEKSLPDGRGLYVPGPLQHMSVAYTPPKKRRKKRKRDGTMDRVIEKRMVPTPGGRMGDTSSLAKPGYDGPRRIAKYIRMVAHAMMRKGHPKSQAIRLARGIVQNWASGQGDVSPKVRAAAIKALAEQKALDKAGSVAKSEQTTWNMEDYQMIVKQLTEEGAL